MVKNRCRRLECIRVDGLEDIERLYHNLECECELCKRGDIMQADMKLNDVVKFSLGGREATGWDFYRKAKERELEKIIKHYKESRPDLNLTDEQIMYELCKKQPALMKEYLGR